VPPAYGGPPPYGVDPYGQPQSPAGYGQPMPMQQPGPMGQAMLPYGQAPRGPMVGTLKSSRAGTTGPTRRNALMTMLLPWGIVFGGFVLSVILSIAVGPTLGMLGSLVALGGCVWYLLIAIQMMSELKSVTHNEVLAWWALIVPLYQLYVMWIVVPQEVAKAKQMLGVRTETQPILLYVLLWPFALASDLNDMVRST
jgi:hypothetical protein